MTDYLHDTVQEICACIRFDSSEAKSSAEYPFGKGAADCLNYFLALAQRLGFQTYNYDNYIGEVIYGDGPEEFAVLCHLDVVPAGGGWTKEPFGGIIEDGRIYGRGATDDKGPAVCALYAMKALKDEGFVPKKRIKLIVGCNEENGWRCIEHYNQFATLPDEGFSPDANFPVIYAEKGILQLRLHFPFDRSPFLFMEGGKQPNMVCDFCKSTMRSVNVTLAEKYGLTIAGKRLLSYGRTAHASTPELGQNAILPMLRYYEGKSPEVRRILECVFDDIYGLRELKDETGSLTMSPNVIKFRKGQLNVTVDIRYPATIAPETVYALVDKFNVKYETLHHQRPLFHSKESPLIQTLLSVYRAATGDESAQPLAIGGGTYARALKRGVGFGPEMGGEDCHIHQADEFIEVSRVALLLEIYRNALRELTKA